MEVAAGCLAVDAGLQKLPQHLRAVQIDFQPGDRLDGEDGERVGHRLPVAFVPEIGDDHGGAVLL